MISLISERSQGRVTWFRITKQPKNSLLLNYNFFRCNALKKNTKFCSKVSSPESAKEFAAISHSKTKQTKILQPAKKIAATHSKQQKKSATNSSSSELLKLQQTQNNKKNLQQNVVQQFCNKFLFFWTAKIATNSKNKTKFYNKIFSNNSAKNSSTSELQRLQQTQKKKKNKKFCKKE